MNSAPNKIDIDEDVVLLSGQIAALRALGAADADEPITEGRRYDFSIGWGTAMAGRFRRLVHYSALGKLDTDDQRRFELLCTELRGLSNLIDRFGLARPVFTDAPPATAKRLRPGGRTRR
ncbi:hypothetical protein VT930_12430 [Mycobacterium sherrisii]|uniref:Uncharacterized protein n=1 Tax=Mycobacterium sherrisii TaxID=243061 RepID=A0A1E3SZ34_9MYCO|nr:hypothetical protein [Mycobacterium sherrisii]MEC4763912.1 hypothetical protein [Mycobacterium sherrisii]ODR06828.1 hypothetical protein BHQ21_10530 [Mycobacterium sherrisii]